MRNLNTVGIISLVVLLGFFSGTSSAANILEVTSSFRLAVIEHNAHGTCVDISWSHEAIEGTSFDLQASSEVGFCVLSNWGGHCDSNGFLFFGELSPNPDAWPFGWGLMLECQISLFLEVSTPTPISASRIVDGVFPGSQHIVTITYPDGSDIVLLGQDNNINSAEELLDPGIYHISFSTNSLQSENLPFDYTGQVEVNWGSPVSVDIASWGAVKSLYRAGN